MSRLLEEFKGTYGNFFKEGADKQILNFSNAYIDSEGILRWKSNNNIPPADLLELWEYAGLKFNYEKTLCVGRKEIKKSLENYLNEHRNWFPSDEEREELKASSGTGKKIVDVITGEHIII